MNGKAATPRVSVVMGVRDGANTLLRAVASILEQTHADLEFIVVDDGSTDGTPGLLDRLARADARLRVDHQPGGGLTSALIRGCALARGEFIARQDADDWSHRQRIQDQLELLDGDPRIDFVSCATEFVGPGDEHLSVLRRPTDAEVATRGLLLERMGPPAHGSVMFRRSAYEAVGGYRAEFRYSQDSDLWLRLGERGRIAYVPEVRYHHRKDAAGISGSRRVQQSEFARIAHACRAARVAGRSETELLEAAAQLSAAAPAAAGASGDAGLAISYLIGSQLARNGDRRARRYLWPVLARRPWHWRAWLRLGQALLSRRPW